MKGHSLRHYIEGEKVILKGPQHLPSIFEFVTLFKGIGGDAHKIISRVGGFLRRIRINPKPTTKWHVTHLD